MNRKHIVNNVFNARASAYRMPVPNFGNNPSFSEVPFGFYEAGGEHNDGAIGRGPPPTRVGRAPGPPLRHDRHSPEAGVFENEEDETSPLDLTSSSAACSINTQQQQQGFYVHKSMCASEGDYIWFDPPHENFSGGTHKHQTVS